MRLLLSLLLLAPAAFAQEETSDEEGEVAPSEHPGLDSPEAVRLHKYEGPRRRAQAFLIPMDEKARAPTARVAQAIEGVLARTPMYEVVDLGRILSVESTSAAISFTDSRIKYFRLINSHSAAGNMSRFAASNSSSRASASGLIADSICSRRENRSRKAR